MFRKHIYTEIFQRIYSREKQRITEIETGEGTVVKGRKERRGGERERLILHVLVHSANDHKAQD